MLRQSNGDAHEMSLRSPTYLPQLPQWCLTSLASLMQLRQGREARGEVDGGAAEGEARWYGRQRTMG